MIRKKEPRIPSRKELRESELKRTIKGAWGNESVIENGEQEEKLKLRAKTIVWLLMVIIIVAFVSLEIYSGYLWVTKY